MVPLARAALALIFVATFSIDVNAFVVPASLATRQQQHHHVLQVATSPDETTSQSLSPQKLFCDVPPFHNIMAANRAEIAVRIMRAATELNAGTVAIYGHEDRYSQHRWGADRSFLLEKKEGASPISAYLDIDQVISIAKEAQVDAVRMLNVK